MMYGQLPDDLGLVDINPAEMMFWLYCPIKLALSTREVILPQNLEQFRPIVDQVYKDICRTDYDKWRDSYVYLTAKTLFVSPGNIGNRPGWHSDGFGTSDLNYIWYDRSPTEFIEGDFAFSDDCQKSMVEMEEAAFGRDKIVYPNKHLLKLDSRVIHRSPEDFSSGMRTFVKVSISYDKYDLEGNSVNHGLNFFVDHKPRNKERNHPSSVHNLEVI